MCLHSGQVTGNFGLGMRGSLPGGESKIKGNIPWLYTIFVDEVMELLAKYKQVCKINEFQHLSKREFLDKLTREFVQIETRWSNGGLQVFEHLEY